MADAGAAVRQKRDAPGGGGDCPAPKRPAPAAAAAPARPCPNDGKPRVCLGATGSVAAVKLPELVELLLDGGAYVDLVLTRSAAFFQGVTYRGEAPSAHLARLEAKVDAAGTPRLCVWRDEDEWSAYDDVGASSVLHIDLAKRNQLLLIAPLCANTLASLALGLCGGLLTSVSRAWHYDMEEEFSAPLIEKYGRYAVNRPVLVAPAMNTYMWYQKITGQHIRTLEQRGIGVVDPVTKTLACGDTGKGAMAPTEEIARQALRKLAAYRKEEQVAVEVERRPPFCP